MSNFPTTKYRAQDANGTAISGAALYFYEAGTSTPLATYSDEDLTSANANPVIADSGGWFGEIYMTPEMAYKVVLQDAAGGSTILETDDIYASMLSSSALATRVKQIASSPLDYGAVGDGAADESSEVQQAIDAATGTIDLLGKTFRCDSGITLRSGLTLRNGTLDFSASASSACIAAAGTRASPVSLTADAAAGATSITASISGLSIGDWIFIYSTQSWNAAGDDAGEFAQVQALAGSTITLRAKLDGSYATASAAEYRRIEPVQDLTIENVHVISNTAAAGDTSAIELELCNRSRLRDVRIESADYYGVRLLGCTDTVIDGLTIEGAATTSYGVDIAAASSLTTISSLTTHQMGTYGVRVGEQDANGGICRDTAIKGCVFNRSGGVLLMSTSQRVIVDGCTVRSTSGKAVYGHGIDVTARNVLSIGAEILLEGDCTSTDPQPWRLTVEGCTIRDVNEDGIKIDPNADCGSIIIRDNTVRDVAGTNEEGISVATSATVQTVDISGNTIHTTTGDGIKASFGAGEALDVRVAGNWVYDAYRYASGSGDCIDIDCDGSVTISGNRVDITTNADTSGITLTGAGTAKVFGNHVDSTVVGPLGYGIKASDFRQLAVVGNRVDGMGSGIEVATGITHIVEAPSISGNTVRDCDTGIKVSGNTARPLEGFAVTGNSLEGIDPGLSGGEYGVSILGAASGGAVVGNAIKMAGSTSTAISVAGTSAGDMEGVAVSGNGIHGGATGVLMSNCAHSCVVGDNAISDCSGDYNIGTLDGQSALKTLRFTFNPSVNVAERSVTTHALAEELPSGATVIQGNYYVVTTFQSGTDAATISLGVASTGILASAAAINVGTTWDAGWHDLIPDDTAANAVGPTTQQRAIYATVGVESLIAGKLNGFLTYLLTG